MDTRVCKKCGIEKPIEDFPKYRWGGREGRRSACAKCCAAKTEAWRQNNMERWKKQSRHYHNTVTKQRYRGLRKAVIAAYGNKCACCGERNPAFLTIDHTNRDGHLQRGERHPAAGIPFLLWIIDNDFPGDLRVMCYNCNCAREFNDGVCPHQEGSEASPQGRTSEATADGSASHPETGDEMVHSQWKH